MKKIYIAPRTSVINLYTAEEIAQQEETNMIGYSRKKGEFPGDDEGDFAKDGYHDFFDLDDSDWSDEEY